MPGKLDCRRARERNRRRAILTLYGAGKPIEEVARKAGTSPRVVEQTLEATGIRGLLSQQQQTSQEAVNERRASETAYR
jgi:transposase